jgi:hypothetical protein
MHNEGTKKILGKGRGSGKGEKKQRVGTGRSRQIRFANPGALAENKE